MTDELVVYDAGNDQLSTPSSRESSPRWREAKRPQAARRDEPTDTYRHAMPLFPRPCGAKLRNKPGELCRTPALKGCAHCRIHAGRPPNSGTPEGAAATRAGHAAHYAKLRAAKARGEPVPHYGGRKRNPETLLRKLRAAVLTEADQAVVLVEQLDHAVRLAPYGPPEWCAITSTAAEARALNSLERQLVVRLRGGRPLPESEVDRLFDLIRSAERTLELPGRDARLQRLWWEQNQWCLRSLAPPPPARAEAIGEPGPDRWGAPSWSAEDAENLRRRQALEGSYEQWKTALADPDVHAQNLPKSRARTSEPRQVSVFSASSPVSPLARQPVDNFVDNSDSDQAIEAEIDALLCRLDQFNLAESARQQLNRELARAGLNPADRLSILRRQVEQVERANESAAAIRQGRSLWAAHPPADPEPYRGLHSAAPWLRGR